LGGDERSSRMRLVALLVIVRFLWCPCARQQPSHDIPLAQLVEHALRKHNNTTLKTLPDQNLAPPRPKKTLRQVAASIVAASIPAASTVWLCDQFKDGNTLLPVGLELTTYGSQGNRSNHWAHGELMQHLQDLAGASCAGMSLMHSAFELAKLAVAKHPLRDSNPQSSD
jgi:hypothetical protein